MANLIKNPGFELYDVNGLTEWICDNVGNEDQHTCPVRDTSQKHSGSASAYSNVPGTADITTGHIQQWVRVEPNTEYKFSAWFKAENFGGSRANIHPAINLTEADFNYQTIPAWHPEYTLPTQYYTNLLDPLIGVTRPLSFDWRFINNLVGGSTRFNSFVTSPWTYWIKVTTGTWKSYGKFWVDDLDLHATCEASECDFAITQ